MAINSRIDIPMTTFPAVFLKTSATRGLNTTSRWSAVEHAQSLRHVGQGCIEPLALAFGHVSQLSDLSHFALARNAPLGVRGSAFLQPAGYSRCTRGGGPF